MTRIKAKLIPIKVLLNRTKPGKDVMWDTLSKSKVIESICIRLPLPMLYVDTSKDQWSVLNGSLMIVTLREYIIENRFALEGLSFLPELEGLKFSQLHRHYQRELEETELFVCLIETSEEIADKLQPLINNLLTPG